LTAAETSAEDHPSGKSRLNATPDGQTTTPTDLNKVGSFDEKLGEYILRVKMSNGIAQVMLNDKTADWHDYLALDFERDSVWDALLLDLFTKSRSRKGMVVTIPPGAVTRQQLRAKASAVGTPDAAGGDSQSGGPSRDDEITLLPVEEGAQRTPHQANSIKAQTCTSDTALAAFALMAEEGQISTELYAELQCKIASYYGDTKKKNPRMDLKELGNVLTPFGRRIHFRKPVYTYPAICTTDKQVEFLLEFLLSDESNGGGKVIVQCEKADRTREHVLLFDLDSRWVYDSNPKFGPYSHPLTQATMDRMQIAKAVTARAFVPA